VREKGTGRDAERCRLASGGVSEEGEGAEPKSRTRTRSPRRKKAASQAFSPGSGRRCRCSPHTSANVLQHLAAPPPCLRPPLLFHHVSPPRSSPLCLSQLCLFFFSSEAGMFCTRIYKSESQSYSGPRRACGLLSNTCFLPPPASAAGPQPPPTAGARAVSEVSEEAPASRAKTFSPWLCNNHRASPGAEAGVRHRDPGSAQGDGGYGNSRAVTTAKAARTFRVCPHVSRSPQISTLCLGKGILKMFLSLFSVFPPCCPAGGISPPPPLQFLFSAEEQASLATTTRQH